MTVYDGTDAFTGNIVAGNKLDTTVFWHGTALPVGAANKVPQNGMFLLVDSLSAPTAQTLYIQTSATLSSPSFVEIPFPTVPPQLPILDRITNAARYGVLYNVTPSGAALFGANAYDGDFSTVGNTLNFPTTGTLEYDFGEVLNINHDMEFRSKVDVQGTAGNTTRTALSYYNGSSWVQIHIQDTGGSAGLFTRDNTTTVTAPFKMSKLRITTTTFVVGHWKLWDISMKPKIISASSSSGTASNCIDFDPSTACTTGSDSPPRVTLDCSTSADKNIHGVLIDIDKAVTTETVLIFAYSDNNSFFTDVRRVNVSDLADGINYIRFNTTPQTRYFRIIGIGSSKILSLKTVAPLMGSSTLVFHEHKHVTIDPTTAQSPVL